MAFTREAHGHQDGRSIHQDDADVGLRARHRLDQAFVAIGQRQVLTVEALGLEAVGQASEDERELGVLCLARGIGQSSGISKRSIRVELRKFAYPPKGEVPSQRVGATLAAALVASHAR
jgi:hypothetical protein